MKFGKADMKAMAMKRMAGPLLEMIGDGDNFKVLLKNMEEKYSKGHKKANGNIVKLTEGEKVSLLIHEVKEEVRISFTALSNIEGEIKVRPLESLKLSSFFQLMIGKKNG